MIDAKFIFQVLNPEAVRVPAQDQNGRRFIRLKENDPSAKLKTVDLYGVSPDAVAVKLDSGVPPADLLDKKGGQRRRCDYLLVTEFDKRKILLYIDLKSSHVDNDVKLQFKGGVCLVKYLDAVMEQFHARKGFFETFGESRFVAFYKPPRLHKMPSRAPQAVGNTKIDKFYKYANPLTPHVKQLVG